MVFYIAAAYGFDPHDPMRPAELLFLWGVYETPAQARESLDGVGESMAVTVVKTQLSKPSQRSLTNRMLRYVGKRTVKRYGGRMIPLLGAPISAIQNGGSTKDLGRRALKYYGGERYPGETQLRLPTPPAPLRSPGHSLRKDSQWPSASP